MLTLPQSLSAKHLISKQKKIYILIMFDFKTKYQHLGHSKTNFYTLVKIIIKYFFKIMLLIQNIYKIYQWLILVKKFI